ncbi:MAG: nitrogenase [Lachnospiraceae bacterium]|nr:nitrogenase [Lachnospiraceae bacterium]
MLTRVTPGARGITPEEVRVRIGEAVFPNPWKRELEFNPPVHETWNIVHIGMLLPQAHQIYVCAENCMRGVVMTAAEMDALERFSCVLITESDLYRDNLESITLEGVTDVLHKLPALPPAVIVFPVCLHHFMGCDLQYVYAELEKRFPDVVFVRAWMDPVMQKTGPTPDEKLRTAMADLLTAGSAQPYPEGGFHVSVIGDNLPLEEDSDIARLVSEAGARLHRIQDCGTFAAYRQMAGSDLFIARSPLAAPGMRRAAKRLGKPGLYLPNAYGYEEIRRMRGQLAGALGLQPDTALFNHRQNEEIEACEAALAGAKATVGTRQIAIDAAAVQRPLGWARLLLEHGFAVKTVYLDMIHPEEEKDFLFLQESFPDLYLHKTVHIGGRVLHGGRLCREEERAAGGEEVLAIGPKAAWYEDTPWFVNMVEYGGLWGYYGIRRMAQLMEEACLVKKDTKEIVQRKGLGCTCILPGAAERTRI